MQKIVRYAVRPARTQRGWAVWAVYADQFGNERLDAFPAQNTLTKKDAKSIAKGLTAALAAKNR